MNDIFLSYSSVDREWARTLADGLEHEGWSVWWDRTIPAGKSFSRVIAEALAEARCVVVVWSNESIQSSWVYEEAEEGRKRNALVPVFKDNVPPPLGFRSIQAADLSAWRGGSDSVEFRRLVADIGSIIGAPIAREAGSEAPPRAGRPEPTAPPAGAPAVPVPSPPARPRVRTDKVPPSGGGSTGVIRRYLALAVGGGLIGGALVGMNHALVSDVPKWGWKALFLAPVIFSMIATIGLIVSKLVFPRLVRRLLVVSVALIAASEIVVQLPAGAVLSNQEGHLMGWSGITLLVLFATSYVPKLRAGSTAVGLFLWSVVFGVAAGAIWATLVALLTNDFAVLVSSDWLNLFGDGVALGALIGGVECVLRWHWPGAAPERAGAGG